MGRADNVLASRGSSPPPPTKMNPKNTIGLGALTVPCPWAPGSIATPVMLSIKYQVKNAYLYLHLFTSRRIYLHGTKWRTEGDWSQTDRTQGASVRLRYSGKTNASSKSPQTTGIQIYAILALMLRIRCL